MNSMANSGRAASSWSSPGRKRFMRKYGEHLGLGDKIGRENIFFSVHAAVEAIQQRDVPAAESGRSG
jgi:hypothetical protein